MGKRAICLIIDDGETYSTIHRGDLYKILSEAWGEEFTSYFHGRGTTSLPELTIGTCIDSIRLVNVSYGAICLIGDGKDYTIIGRVGILIQGEDENKKFFEAIFESNNNR